MVHCAAATNLDEIAENGFALGCVHHFGVKLQSENLRFRFSTAAYGEFSVTATVLKPSGSFVSLSPWNSTPVSFWVIFRSARSGRLYCECAFAVLALETAFNFASEEFRHHLQAKANTQHRDAELEYRLIRQWCLAAVNAHGAAGKNDALGAKAAISSAGVL